MEIDLPSVHAQALLATGALVAGTEATQLGRPTPCEGWDVAALLNHLVSGNLWVEPLMEGLTIEQVGDRFADDVLGIDYIAAFNVSAHGAAVAFQADGAMEAMVNVSYGPVPGSVYCGHRFIDVLVHGWDLAVATDQPRDLPEPLVEACWQVMEPQLEAITGSGAYGVQQEVPASASTQARVLATLGRAG